MKKLLLLSLSFILVNVALAEEIVINGYYQGINLYVLNPFAEDGESFCIEEVTVNGQRTEDIINSSAFEIDLSVYDLKAGDSLSIVIRHKSGCFPKVINVDVLKPRTAFVITSISVDHAGILKWSTIEEQGKLPYIVEQYRWDKWVELGTVQGTGTPSAHDYSFDLNSTEYLRPHSGINKYRVRQTDYQGRVRYSLETSYKLQEEAEVKIKDIDNKTITFTAETSYQIFDKYGEIANDKGKRYIGYSSLIDISELPKGKYFLLYDNAKPKRIKH